MGKASGTTGGLLGGGRWFAKMAGLTPTLGSEAFHGKLVAAFGALIRHSSSWIIQYSRGQSPTVMFTLGVSPEVLAHYDSACSSLDPFSRHWALHEEPGVRTLRQFDDPAGGVDASAYNEAFKPVAKVSDELGMFFSTVGHASIGVFLERETGWFGDDEIELAKAAFPLLDGFYAAHVGRLFAGLRRAGRTSEDGLADRPMLIQDRRGLEILSTPSWRAAAASDRSVGRAVRAKPPGGTARVASHALKREALSEYFPLAPGGAIFILLNPPPPGAAPRRPSRRVAALERSLTAQEAAVFRLIMSGSSTGGIAQRLSISKGSVNNYRAKIYRKAGVHSERALVQKFAAAASIPERHRPDRTDPPMNDPGSR